MSIRVQTKKLRDVFQIAEYTSSKDKNNILSNCLIKLSPSSITVYSTNGLVSSKQKIDAETETGMDETAFIMPPERISSILREFEDEITEISVQDKLIILKNSNFKTSYKTIDPEIYPQEEEEEVEFISKIDFNTLKQTVKSSIYAASKNDISREYTGLLIELDGERITSTATDRYRLATVSTTQKSDKTLKEIIEYDGASLVSRIHMTNAGLYRTLHSIVLRSEYSEFRIKTIEGNFPNYKEILLSEEDNMVIVNKYELLSSLKRIFTVYKNNETSFRIDTEKNQLTLISTSPEGEEATDIINITESTGNGEEFLLDCRYAIDFLTHISSETVKIFYRDKSSPLMFEAENDLFQYKYLIVSITR